MKAEDFIPRKGSVDDPRFHRNVGRNIEVLLDGVKQEKVTAYDCDEGWIERLQVNAAGRFFYHADGRPARERVNGSVTVQWSKP